MIITKYINYSDQLTNKVKYLNQTLLPFNPPALEVFASVAQNFRERAEFKIWHHNNQLNYAMFDQTTKQPIFLDNLPIASVRINNLMQKLTNYWHSPIISTKLFQAEFMSAKFTNDALITLCYHQPLNDKWLDVCAKIAHDLQISIIGRWHKHKIVIGKDYITEQFNVGKQSYIYHQPEGTFSQPNAYVCSHMLNWVHQTLGMQKRDLLELYCGNGNFTLPLASLVPQVLATEINKRAVNAAIDNIALNNIINIKLARLSAEEISKALNKVRVFRRLHKINLDDYDFGTIFVDPPRAGLDSLTCNLTQKFAQIMYISCNPETLYRDLLKLSKTHYITNCALFDQFPFTNHIETGVLLRKK